MPIKPTSEQALYRLLRLFLKSKRAHSFDFAVSFKRIGYTETTVNLNRESQEQKDMKNEKA